MATKSKPAQRAIELERGFTYAEVGTHLGVSARMVKRWCDEGRLGYVRLPRGRRITARHIAEFIAAREVGPVE